MYKLILSLVLIGFISACQPQNTNEALFKIIEEGDTLSFQELSLSDEAINQQYTSDSITLLTYAIEQGKSVMVKYLVQNGADVKNCPLDQNPLILAMQYREKEMYRFLVNQDIDPNESDSEGNTAIHIATKRRDKEVLNKLLELGGDINKQNKNGWTALDYALLANRKNIIEFIQQAGGETYLKTLNDYTEGPYFEYGKNEIRGKYFIHDATQNKTSIDEKVFQGKPGKVKGWYKDSATYYIAETKPEPCVYSGVDKLLAVGDIHGQYERLESNLRSNNVIDAQNNWQWGNGHLVFVGDIFDRGDKVTECLWLIRKLEVQAEKAGGKVHYILGNHDCMMLKNDLRYIHPKYYGLCYNTQTNFASLFTPNTFFGKWLRSRNVMVKINDAIFVHGGISPELANTGLNIDEINITFRKIYAENTPIKSRDTIKLFTSSKGPIWYRGYFRGIEEDQLSDVLNHFNVQKIIVGHTETDTLKTLHHGKVIGINIPLWNTEVPNQALLFENGNFYRMLEGKKVEGL